MLRWFEVIVTLILTALVMSVIGWGLDASVPTVHAWLIDHIGQAGFFTLMGFLVLIGAVAAYRDGRKPKGT